MDAVWTMFAVGAAAAAGVLLGRSISASGRASGAQLGSPASDSSAATRELNILRGMLNGIPDAALILDSNDRIESANTIARDLFPIRDGQSMAQTYRSRELLGAIDKARASGQVQTCETRVLAPIERHLINTVAPLNEPGDGSRAELLVVLRDATNQYQLAQMRADFVANASHELRTPLASLKGFIETLQGAAKNDDAAREKFLPIMNEQANRMSRLIDDLLSLSQIEMREHVRPREKVDVALIAHEIVESLEPIAEAASITLISGQPSGDTAVIGERDELVQAVQNLIENAIKYGKPGGRVEVATSARGSKVYLSVTDDGIGIAAEHVPRLTERFYRVSAKKSHERGGTGLGLAIVKHIVNHHQGELRVESTLDRGSTFTIVLPAFNKYT